MKINHDIQTSQGKLTHFLNIKELPKSYIEDIISRSEEIHNNSNIRKYSENVVASLFFEPSTRTKTTFELASKRLSSNFINIDISNSSTAKGESIIDMVKTIEAMNCQMFVVRHSVPGTAHYIAESVSKNISVINAGDGSNEHPTQAMLDVFTIKKHKGSFQDLKISIVGDILHSRVAKSLIYALNTLGTKQINIVGPEKLIPEDYQELNVNYFSNMDEGINDADVIIMLRLQKERMHDALISLDTYYDDYGLNESRLKYAKDDVIVMHPGPINRGIEIESTVADGPNSVILNQVSYGISVRMAIMSMLFDNNT
ncbi:MAG: aspartate carbamoyltransferase catalytic subunit [Gammaproteobacteria bacterium]